MNALGYALYIGIKFIILSSSYAFLTLIVFRIIGLIMPNGSVRRVSNKKIRFWLLSWVVYSAVLLIIYNTHWGNPGSADIRRIPLEHGRAITQMDGVHNSFENTDYKYEPFFVGNFIIAENYVYTFTPYCTNDGADDYIIWNLETGHIEEIEAYSEFQERAEGYFLPEISEFPSFYENYSDYWFGWRFWLLL